MWVAFHGLSSESVSWLSEFAFFASLLFDCLFLYLWKEPVGLLCVIWRKEINRDGTGTYARFRVLQSSRSARIATLCIIISLLLQPIYIVGLTLFEWAVSKISVLLFFKRSTLYYKNKNKNLYFNMLRSFIYLFWHNM